jgi:predicted kinase
MTYIEGMEKQNLKAFVMVGAPGSGKSTQVKKILLENPDAIVVSGDEIREELYGNADIQGNYAEIHDRMIEIIEENVGRPIILDGTHYRASYRKEALATLNSYGYFDITAVVVNKPLDVCLLQNASRSRVVPRHVIERMWTTLQSSLKNLPLENFTKIEYV